MNRPPVIVAALSPIEVREFLPEPLLAELRSLAPDFHFVDTTGLNPEAWATKLQALNPDIVVGCWSTPKFPDTLPPRLRYVCFLSGSVKKFVTRAHLQAGLQVTNWGNSISRVVAECGLLLMLATLRRSTYWALAMHQQGQWKVRETLFESLFGRRVGLHGFGAIAQELVRLLQPFDVKLSTYSPSVPDALLAEYRVARTATLEDLFASNEMIVELAALTPANHHIVDEKLLRLIPAGGAFVNIGRGAVTDEAAIAKLARENRLQFGIDVFETEPLPAQHPFRGLANITMLPHLGGPTTDRRRDAGAFGLRNLRAFLAGEPLEAVVTPQVFDRTT